MANLCDTIITNCIKADCNNQMFSGVNPEALIANFKQVQKFTYSDTNGNICTGITMDTDANTHETFCWFTVEQLGKEPFSGSQTELVEGTYGNKFTNTISLAVPDNGPEVCHDIVDQLANGKFVVMIQNDYVHSNGDNKYQIFGSKKGLRCTAMTREFYGDNNSYYIVTLTEENAPNSGVFFYVTDETTTDSAVAALKCTCNTQNNDGLKGVQGIQGV